jgi:hypothetical protein
MPEGDQDHSGVPLTIAVIAYGLDQAIDLLLGQVLPRPQLVILQTPRNCSIYARWRDQLGAWLGHIISQAMFEGELDEVLSRVRYARRPKPPSGKTDPVGPSGYATKLHRHDGILSPKAAVNVTI